MGEFAWINDGVQDMIQMFSFDAFWVAVNKTIVCHCIGRPGGDPVPSCPDCLGTGHPVRIKKVKTVTQNATTQFRSRGQNVKNESVNMPMFWFNPRWPVQVDDLIVVDDKVFVINTSDNKRADNGKVAYFYCGAAPKKANQAEFLKNFRMIVGE